MSDDTAQHGHSAHTPHEGDDDHTWWMSIFSALDDHEVDALLSGGAPEDAELAPIAEMARALRGRAAAEPAPTMGPALRAQLAGPAVVAIDVRRAARGALVKAATAAAAAAAVALMGVGAAQNRLPAGVQDAVSSTAELVGIHLPHADERSAEHRQDGDAVDADERGDDGQPGYDGVTPGGADPADPGVPGDKEPATPATPPDKGEQSENDNTPSSTVPEGPDRPENTPSSTVPDKGGPNVVEGEDEVGDTSIEVQDLDGGDPVTDTTKASGSAKTAR